MKNVLYSTTRQYNPGDEFILFGVRNLLEAVGINDNPIIFNRNQEVNQALSFINPLRRIRSQSKIIKIFSSFFRVSQVDNSFKDVHSLDFVDLMVFAGSPEWKSYRLFGLYEKLRRSDIPCIFLGLGSFSNKEKLPWFVKEVVAKSKFISYRSDDLEDCFKDQPYARCMPCPALFSAGIGSFPYVANKKIAITYGTNKASKGNHVSDNAENLMGVAYQYLAGLGYDVTIVCHYIDELPIVEKEYPEAKILYSFDSKEYIEIYRTFSAIISSRVHALGLCASLGIPGLLIAHDGRANTAKGFKADIFSDDSSVGSFKQAIDLLIRDRKARHIELLEHKTKTLLDYSNLLKAVVDEF